MTSTAKIMLISCYEIYCSSRICIKMCCIITTICIYCYKNSLIITATLKYALFVCKMTYKKSAMTKRFTFLMCFCKL